MDTSAWLTELAADAAQLPLPRRPLPYWSQRRAAETGQGVDLHTVTRRVHREIHRLLTEHFFSESLGFECVDAQDEPVAHPDDEIEARVGKRHLWSSGPTGWSEDDLCDVIEVFHDLASRPTRGWVHSYSGCGFHPSAFSKRSGQAIYRWRINEIIGSAMPLKLSTGGEDLGRMIRTLPSELDHLAAAVLDVAVPDYRDVAHGLALFRARSASREQRRSAVVALAGVLEARRPIVKEHLTKDEGALFEIANKFDLRHRKADQQGDYAEEFLEWIFYWYLATIRLTNTLVDRTGDGGSA